VRVLLEATRGQCDFEPVALGPVLEAELSAVADVHGPVETNLAVPEDLEVVADDLLARVFANLFANAVEHHDADTPRLDVTVVPTDDAVAVHVADDGPGVPEHLQSELFERGAGDHGLGLYLFQVLTARYGGSVSLTETGSDGSVFTVELPRADRIEGAPTPTSAGADAIPLDSGASDGGPPPRRRTGGAE